MTKKGLSVIITLSLLVSFICFSVAESTDYSFLDEMSVDELTALKIEIEKRISAQKKSAISSSEYGMWEIRNYVDEFRNPTDQQYVRNKVLITGTFSNSAANDRDLSARFLIDKSGVSLMLYEYGDYQVKNSYSKSRNYKVTMQDGDGKKLSLSGTMSSAGDRIRFSNSDSNRIIQALRHDCKISFYIVDQENKTTTYLFTIDDSSYFSNAYLSFFGDEALPLDVKQEIYPAIYDQKIATTCATQLPSDMLTWKLKEENEHKGDPYFLSGTVISSNNDDKFYVDIGDQLIYVDFTNAYDKKTQNSAFTPSVNDQISVYCTFNGIMWDYEYNKNIAMFKLGLDNKK